MTVSRMMTAGLAAVAACGALGLAPAAARAGSGSTPVWTKQSPATSPIQRIYPSMAYDAATGNVLLFGGQLGRIHPPLRDTWTWDGTTWTQQHPAVSPSARYGATMAYDTATSSALLFGGDRGTANHTRQADSTWTWDGTNWTEQHPATHPAARVYAAMAYDAATGDVVLFGGSGKSRMLGDTWTWNGSTWTQQHPPVHPGARAHATMAYDAATGSVVLFGGDTSKGARADTWTWNGTTWARQHPAASPPARAEAQMTYDGATGTVLLFGGLGTAGLADVLSDTWTWDGSSWTAQTAGRVPTRRFQGAMAYDAAAGSAVVFGGTGGLVGGKFGSKLRSTWTWG